jgi:tRNA-splicing ligase RtcB
MRVLHKADGLFSTRVHIKCWAVDKDNSVNIEEEALGQAINLANLPFAFHHVALMPDCHSGYGMPIGGVVATKGVIVPNMVGVDIGCGVAAIPLALEAKALTEDILKKIIGGAREVIPVGFSHHEKPQYSVIYGDAPKDIEVVAQHLEKSKYQLGTLGGGNHFIEIQADNEGQVWLMVHSGSRNLGKQVADHFNKKAKQLNEKYFSSVNSTVDLAFLPTDTQEGQDYLRAMNFCLEFARANREMMIDRLFEMVAYILGAAQPKGFINVHHNYAALENHFGSNVWVHRKGATKAQKGDICLIPGSMGTATYVAVGEGNPDSFMSCSHGAGRVMSRTKANETISIEQADKSSEGVVFGRWGTDRKGRAGVSECPLAYKNIEDVMGNQEDLVRPAYKLRPLAVMKG